MNKILTPAEISAIELDIAGPHVYDYEMYEGSNYLITERTDPPDPDIS